MLLERVILSDRLVLITQLFNDALSVALVVNVELYEGVSRSFRTESITKYTLTTINTR
jgi:hypothetical protein